MSIKINNIDVIDNNRNANVVSLDVSGTAALKLPVGTTAQRPTPVTGQLRFNTEINRPEVYNGTSWGFVGAAPSIHRYLYRTTNTIAERNDYIFADTTNNSFTVTLPLEPSETDIIYIADYAGKFSTNNLTINRNGNTILGTPQNLILDTNYVYMFYYINGDWKVYTTGLSYVRGDGDAIILSGPVSGFEGDTVNFKIENFAIQGTYTVTVTAGTFNISSGIVYWKLPSLDITTVHTLTVFYEIFGSTIQSSVNITVVPINSEIDDSVILTSTQFENNTFNQGWSI